MPEKERATLKIVVSTHFVSNEISYAQGQRDAWNAQVRRYDELLGQLLDKKSEKNEEETKEE